MKLEASVSWDPSVDFEKATLLKIHLNLKVQRHAEFTGELKNPDIAILYLENLNFYANPIQNCEKLKPKKEQTGLKMFEIPVLSNGKNLEILLYHATRIQLKHYIQPRNAWVRDEEYYKFFGSSGNLWDNKKCDYQN